MNKYLKIALGTVGLWAATQFGLDTDKSSSLKNYQGQNSKARISNIASNIAFAECNDSQFLEAMIDLTRIHSYSKQDQQTKINTAYSYFKQASKGDLESVVSSTFETGTIPQGTLSKSQLADYLYANSFGQDEKTAAEARELAVYLFPDIAEKYSLPKPPEKPARQNSEIQESRPYSYDISLGTGKARIRVRAQDDGNGNTYRSTQIAGQGGAITTTKAETKNASSSRSSLYVRNAPGGPARIEDEHYKGRNYSRDRASANVSDVSVSTQRTKTPIESTEQNSVSTPAIQIGTAGYKTPYSEGSNVQVTTPNGGDYNVSIHRERPADTYKTGSASTAASSPGNAGNANPDKQRFSNEFAQIEALQATYGDKANRTIIQKLLKILNQDPENAYAKQMLEKYGVKY